MKNNSKNLETQNENHASYQTYVIGFVLSIVLTLAAYFLVANQLLSGSNLDGVIIALSLAQIFVQLWFFLHLGDEPKPYWNLLAFGFMALVVIILVAGSLWIMYTLDYRMMPTMPTETGV